MKLYVPDYYPEFRCIADRCRHSCCIGWEIEIDDVSMERYRTISGELGERLKQNITEEQSFCLDESERCPFLNSENLCDLIIALGEESLCNICRDHPRFRNFFEDRVEMGLGLCCEAVGELILKRTEPFSLVCIEDDGEPSCMIAEEELFYSFREELFSCLFRREISLKERIAEMQKRYRIPQVKKTKREWLQIFQGLERMDSCWDDYLQALQSGDEADVFSEKEWESVQEQLLAYFFFRHLPDGIYEEDIPKRLAFCLLSVYIISLLYAYWSKETSTGLSLWIELARIYSAEIEYAEENVESLISVME